MFNLIISLFFVSYSSYAKELTASDFKKSPAYLKTCQKNDGGFGESGMTSNSTVSLTAALAILQLGEDPHFWLVQNKNPIAYLGSLNNNLLTLSALSMKIMVYSRFKSRYTSELDLMTQNILSRTQQLFDKENKYYLDEIWLLRADADYKFLSKDLKEKIVEKILQFQNPDGGFRFEKDSVSEPNMTALVIMALKESGFQKQKEINKALGFLNSSKNVISWIPSKKSDSVTTSQFLQMYSVLNIRDAQSSQWASHLLSFLNNDGSFNWTQESVLNPCFTTAFALMALNPTDSLIENKRFSAIKKNIKNPKSIKVKLRLTLNDENIFSTNAMLDTEKSRIKSRHGSYGQNPDVFSISQNIFKQKNIKFKAFDTYGDSFESILGVQGALPPQQSWHYKVNNKTTDICSVAHSVTENDEILWYYGYFGAKVLGLKFYKTKNPKIIKIQSVYFNDNTQVWEPEPQVNLKIKNQTVTTDDQGFIQVGFNDIKKPLMATKNMMINSNSYSKKEILNQLISEEAEKLD